MVGGPDTCLGHIVTPLANLLDYREVTIYSFRSFGKQMLQCYMGINYCLTAGYLAALVALVI